MFRVGQKVIYVGIKRSIWHAIQRRFYPYEEPARGRVYTVCNAYVSGTEPLIELIEFPSPADGYWNAGFLAKAFRPVAQRKTDIGFAHEILRKVSRKQGADA